MYWQLANQLAPSRRPVYWTLDILELARAQNDITRVKVDQLGRKNGGAVGAWLRTIRPHVKTPFDTFKYKDFPDKGPVLTR